ncbi:flagellar protein FlgN [Candidatus Neomarinimicrobiota bacterium]
MTSRPSADRLIARLITILSEEMQMYNDLLLVLRRKQSNIIEGKVKELSASIQDEQEILQRTEAIGKSRDEAFRQVSEALGQQEIRKISTLVDLVESSYAERLSDIHASLQRILKDVILTNEENRHLLEYSINFVREAARELVRSSQQFPVYSAEGKGHSRETGGSLLEGRV